MNLDDIYFGIVVVASVILLAWVLDLFMKNIEDSHNE